MYPVGWDSSDKMDGILSAFSRPLGDTRVYLRLIYSFSRNTVRLADGIKPNKINDTDRTPVLIA